jgi:hypothetical protein
VAKKLFFVFVFAIASTAAQAAEWFGFGAGVKGGFPFTDFVTPSGNLSATRTDNYLIGPVMEFRLPLGFAFEADGLYRGTQYQIGSAGAAPVTFNSSSWEIPYLAKFRFPIPVLKPFVSAGGAYRTFSDLPSGVDVNHNAFVAGAGLELRIQRLRLSAEGRYLYWGSSPANPVFRIANNEGEVLFGITF